jgi:hypothetical protein
LEAPNPALETQEPGSNITTLVDLMTAYLNPAEQVTELRATLAKLAAPDTPTDARNLGDVIPPV